MGRWFVHATPMHSGTRSVFKIIESAGVRKGGKANFKGAAEEYRQNRLYYHVHTGDYGPRSENLEVAMAAGDIVLLNVRHPYEIALSWFKRGHPLRIEKDPKEPFARRWDQCWEHWAALADYHNTIICPVDIAGSRDTAIGELARVTGFNFTPEWSERAGAIHPDNWADPCPVSQLTPMAACRWVYERWGDKLEAIGYEPHTGTD